MYNYNLKKLFHEDKIKEDVQIEEMTDVVVLTIKIRKIVMNVVVQIRNSLTKKVVECRINRYRKGISVIVNIFFSIKK